jgi:GrpB-like predicted nucleotidyltransferase (UPF0157 family)
LLKARKRRDRISFEYETASNKRITEEWNLVQLYEFWLKASNQRQERYEVVKRELSGGGETPSSRLYR